jgi:hypothetical protein
VPVRPPPIGTQLEPERRNTHTRPRSRGAPTAIVDPSADTATLTPKRLFKPGSGLPNSVGWVQLEPERV